MGHTRKGTYGLSNTQNAHPHVIDDKYVQTHNGTIKEIWPLCNKYDVNHTGVQSDSIALGKLIVKLGLKTVLEEYRGTAALAFTWLDKPEALYLYHGASKETEHGLLQSERPMWTLQQPEGLYYSSTKESLDIINSIPDEAQPQNMLHNAVYEVIDGEFTGNDLIISRSENNVIKYTPVVQAASKAYNKITDFRRNAGKQTQSIVPIVPKRVEDDDDELNRTDLLMSEKYPQLSLLDVGRVLYFKGKYYRVNVTKGHPYIAIMDGEAVINIKGYIIDPANIAVPPNGQESWYYFIHGVMVKSKDDYLDCQRGKVFGMSETSFKQLSFRSRYPIIQLTDAFGIGNNMWMHRGNRVKRHTFSPKFSGMKIKIQRGITKQIFPNE